jgi:hypothetical protein
MPKQMRLLRFKHEKDGDFFVRLEPILAIIRTTILTGRIEGCRPVSLMLIAKQESAKTECLKHFFGTDTLEYLSDLTSRGMHPYRDKIQSGVTRHMVLLDLIRVAAHGKGVTERTLQTLASLMEEGETSTSDAGGRESWTGFPRIGVLTALTPELFHTKRGHWRKTGFLTRFLPISFGYSDRTVLKIHDSISKGMSIPPPEPVKVPAKPIRISIGPLLSKEVAMHAASLGRTMKTYGFRYQKAMRALAMASAYERHSKEVERVDVDRIIDWSDFFTMKEVEL